MVDFEKIKNIAGHDENYLRSLLPEAEKRGNELVCANVFGKKGTSFSYNLASGLWADFATGQSGASIIDLIMARENCTAVQAANIINDKLRIGDIVEFPTELQQKQTEEKRVTSVPAPKGSRPHYILRGEEKIKPSNVWVYYNSEGYPVAADCRIDNEDGSKDVLPMLYNGKNWYSKALPKDRYLYNLDKIYADIKNTVIVSEGCKTAEAVAKYFPNYTSTTWQGGCKAVKKTDWRPLFGRKVIIIPDADDCGLDAAKEIGTLLVNGSCEVRIVDTMPMMRVKKGWDIADALAGGMDQKELVEYVKEHISHYFPEPVNDDVIDTAEIKVEKKVTYDDTYFRALGVQSDKHYYFKKNTSQIIEMTPSKYDSKHLINLAPLAWWEAIYPSKTGTDWTTAIDDLCRIQEKVGIFDNTKIRGRGAWFDNGRAVLHLGNILYCENRLVNIDDFKSEYFYERAPALAIKLQTVLPTTEASKLIDICQMARWEKKSYGMVLAGWMFSALVCGAMPFRSHLYMIGAAGTGKSWMLDNIVKRIMGNMALSVSSKSTEAGIRDQLGGDIRPVIFDEAEAEQQQDKMRMQSVFDLARNGSSEKADAIVKFGAKYVCRSAFLFASINSSMSKTADLSRTAFIKLANAPVNKSKEAKEHDNLAFRELERETSYLLTDEYCQCLLSRAIAMVNTMRKSHAVVANVAAKDFGSRRLGDQMAMIVAGIHGLRSENVITEEEARELIKITSLQTDKEDADDKTQEENALDHLLFASVETQARVGNRKYLLNVLLAVIAGVESLDSLETESVKKDLASKGFLIGSEGINQYLYISCNKASLPNMIFEKTEWQYSWQEALLRIEGVEKTTNNKYFCSTLLSRAVKIPLDMVIKSDVVF